MHLRFRQIRYFVEIVDAGSMTRAAERLSLAPTALSLQIRKLEDEFGICLLDRHARGVTPTERGARFYESARHILDLLGAAERLLSERDGPTARYRLGISSSVLHAIDLAALLPGQGTRSVVSIHIVEGPSADLTSRLESGDIDFAFGWLGSRVPVAHVDLVEEQFVFVTACRGNDPAPATGPTGAATFAEVVGSDLMRLSRQKASWEVLRKRAAQEGLNLDTDRI